MTSLSSIPIFVFLSLLSLLALPSLTRAQDCRITPPYANISVIQITPTPDDIPKLTTLLLAHCELRLLSESPNLRPNAQNILFVTRAQLTALQQCACAPSLQVISEQLSTTIATWPTQNPYIPRPTSASTSAPFRQGTANSDPPAVLDTDFYSSYRTYDTLLEKQEELLTRFAPILTRTSLGTTIEGRDIFAFTIGSTDPDDPKRLFLNGMQHAREWVATVVPHYLIEFLAVALTNGDQPLTRLLSSVQVIIVPLVNADGYVYSNDVDRFWRKNRRLGTGCLSSRAGVDLNRNWGQDFGGPESTSTQPCSDIFIGAAAFSEPETAALRDFVLATPGIKAHVDFHSFGQLVLGAWSFSDDTPPRVNEVDGVGRALERALTNSNRQQYEFGRGDSGLLYLASGVMPDWMFMQGALSYTIELRPKAQAFANINGFLLDEQFLLPTCEEGVAAVRTLLNFTVDAEAFMELVPDTDITDGSPMPGSGDDSGSGTSMQVPRDNGNSVSAWVIVGASLGLLVAVSVIVGVVLTWHKRRAVANEIAADDDAVAADIA